MFKILKNFIHINRVTCARLENILPHTKPDFTNLYSEIITKLINMPQKKIVVDIGGGRETPYAIFCEDRKLCQIFAIDIDSIELNKNKAVDKRIIADVNKTLPLGKSSVNLITSRYVFEHLNNIDHFVSQSARILKKDGYSIHLLSSKYAVFALLNQLLPIYVSSRLLKLFVPGGTDIHGFKTNYSHCTYNEIERIFKQHKFKIEKLYLSYYQSRYFSFFLPIFLLTILYELILYIFGLKKLAAYILVVARKI